MLDKQTFSTGDRIDQMCITCGEERGHIVASIGKNGRITRVSCPVCGSRSVPKLQATGTRNPSVAKKTIPYDRTRSYRKGENVMHPMFGQGEVTGVIEPHKMDVLFDDRLRRLVCGNS